MNSFNEVMKRTASKINFARQSLKGKNDTIRDEQGLAYTANRIITGIENFMDLGSGNKFMLNEAIAAGIKQNFARNKHNFSASDLASLNDVDVADIAIGVTLASHGITYGAMERAMDSTHQNIAFQGLKAVNTAGGMTAGDTVMDPRTGLPTALDISRNGARVSANLDLADITTPGDAITVPLSTPGPVVVGETKVYIVLTAEIQTAEPTLIAYATGKDKVGSDNLEDLVLVRGGFIDEAKVNIATGALSAKSVADLSNYTLIVERCYDRIAESDGAHTLKLKAFMDHAELVATENRIILQSSIEVQAQMNKILRKNSAYGVTTDFGKRAIDQVIQLITYFIDTNIVRQLYEGSKSLAVTASLDLTGFASSDYKSFSSTKNDRLNLFTRELTSSFLTRTGSPVTAIFTDEVGALMYSSDTDNFKEDAAFRQRRDGLIGYYDNIPIIRNTFLNGKAGGNKGIVLGVHKSLNGEAAPVAIGDYLTPYSTLPALNPNNPGEMSQALFSQTACKCVVPEFIVKGIVNPYTNQA